MKKTTTRLAAIGGLIVLGACAIALAQYDSRKRERDPIRPQAYAPEQAAPIEVEGDWGRPSGAMGKSIVRANNDRLTSYGSTEEPPSNLLRGGGLPVEKTEKPAIDQRPSLSLPAASTLAKRAAEFADFESSQLDAATLASGGAPTDPPGWLHAPSTSPNQSQRMPALPGTSGVGTIPTAAPNGLPRMPSGTTAPPTGRDALPTATNTLQPVPGFPHNAQNPGSTSPGLSTPLLPSRTQPTPSPASLPGAPVSAATPATTNRPAARNPANDMSDTQRGALLPTDLSPARTNTPVPSNVPVSPSQPATSPAYGNSIPDRGSANSSGFLAPPGQSLPNANIAQQTRPQSAPFAQVGNSIPTLPADRTPSTAGVASLPAMPTTNGRQAAVGTPASLVSNLPGSSFLNGSQNPIMLIQKRAPEEIQVGKKATFQIMVRNAGNAVAHDVTVVDSIPRGARFVASTPAVRPTRDGILNWKLGELAAGDERTITLQIVPEKQGEVGSVASVHFATQASVRTVATLPQLEVLLQSEPNVLIGDVQQIRITVKNTGTGVARGVQLEADLPPQLQHESGDAELNVGLGDMRPHDERSTVLFASAVQPGQGACLVRAVSDDGINVQEQVGIDVRAAQLVATIAGPKLRYLERQATFRVSVNNSGTAAATNLNFLVHLPIGLKFNSANNNGTYHPDTHSIDWGLHELPAGQPATVEFTVLPVELGPQAIAFTAQGDLELAAEAKHQVMVDGLAKLEFTIGQDNGTIEVGSSSTYSVQVTNVGNKPDKDVRLAVELPAGTKLLNVVAPVEYQVQGRSIVFAPVAEMRNKDQHTFRFQVQHNQPGSHIVRTKLTSANWPVPVVKEEGTLVYNDQN